MASIAAILASATEYTGVYEIFGHKGLAGFVVSGPLGTVAKEDGGEWRHYTPVSETDTPCYPCEGWPIDR